MDKRNRELLRISREDGNAGGVDGRYRLDPHGYAARSVRTTSNYMVLYIVKQLYVN